MARPHNADAFAFAKQLFQGGITALYREISQLVEQRISAIGVMILFGISGRIDQPLGQILANVQIAGPAAD
jgi:hypothetical protein